MEDAVKRGHLDEVKALWATRDAKLKTRPLFYDKERQKYINKYLNKAIKWDQVHIIAWCMQEGAYVVNGLLDACSLQSIIKLHDLGVIRNIKMRSVVKRGDMDIIKWVHHNKTTNREDEYVTFDAAYGSLEILQYLYDHGYPLHHHCGEGAALRGNLSMLQWLSDKIRISLCASKQVVRSGRLKVIKWLIHNDLLDLESLDFCDHLNIIKYVGTC